MPIFHLLCLFFWQELWSNLVPEGDGKQEEKNDYEKPENWVALDSQTARTLIPLKTNNKQNIKSLSGQSSHSSISRQKIVGNEQFVRLHMDDIEILTLMGTASQNKNEIILVINAFKSSKRAGLGNLPTEPFLTASAIYPELVQKFIIYYWTILL